MPTRRRLSPRSFLAREAYSFNYLDGAGRVHTTALDQPCSTGLYNAQYFVYDDMGRVIQQSKPTEINSSLFSPVTTPYGFTRSKSMTGKVVR